MEDAEQEWTFSLSSFDYIHMRTLNGSIQDWNKLFQQSFDTLRPGGWIETYESECVFGSENCELPDDSPLKSWSEYFHEAGKRMSRTFHVLSENVQVEGIRAAGFRNIKVVPLRVSLQPLPDIDPAAAAWESSTDKRYITCLQSPVGSWPSDPELKRSGAYAKLALEQDLEGENFLVCSI